MWVGRCGGRGVKKKEALMLTLNEGKGKEKEGGGERGEEKWGGGERRGGGGKGLCMHRIKKGFQFIKSYK